MIDKSGQRCATDTSDERNLRQGELAGEAERVSSRLLGSVGAVGESSNVKGRVGVDGALVAADCKDLRNGGGEGEDVGLDFEAVSEGVLRKR